MGDQIISIPAHLEPSPLGTKEYWDKLYETEISNHVADPSDLGTIWFDDSSAEDKVLAFLHSPRLSLDRERTSFLDVGTGNGHFLFRLREDASEDEEEEEDHGNNGDVREHGGDGYDGYGGSRKSPVDHIVRTGAFRGRKVGTDYSLKSIEFAQRVAAGHNSPIQPAIEFVHYDIMAVAPALNSSDNASTETNYQNENSSIAAPHHPLLTPPNTAGYDVVLDKGTFDAISLSNQELDDDIRSGKKKKKKRLCEGYKSRILPLVKEDGIFVITSCNWTEVELRAWFEGPRRSSGPAPGEGNDTAAGEGDEELEPEMDFVFETGLKYKSFRFGGREGQSISSVCFRKKRRVQA